MTQMMTVEIAYATAEQQKIICCEMPLGTSVREAVKQSDIGQYFPEIDLDHCDLGVFGQLVAQDYQLLDGDRIEIYRPLIADPKEVRRRRAEQGLTMRKPLK